MDPTNKPKGASPHYSLYQRNVFKAGGTTGQRLFPSYRTYFALFTDCVPVPNFSVHADELQESTKRKLSEHGYFYANSNAGLGWTDRANRWGLLSCLPPSLR